MMDVWHRGKPVAMLHQLDHGPPDLVYFHFTYLWQPSRVDCSASKVNRRSASLEADDA